MMALTSHEAQSAHSAVEAYVAALERVDLSMRIRRNFDAYRAIRAANGDTHLNQAFDPRHTRFGGSDFWLSVENRQGTVVATYCSRRLAVADFYDVIRSQTLWFGGRPRLVDPRFVVVSDLPAFGGVVLHGGGLWVRRDHRGVYRLAEILPRLARAIALRIAPFDHDSGMIRDDPADPPRLAERKARAMALRTYGFARVSRFVDGWFPPERRNAIVHLCHATRAEAVASLAAPPPAIAAQPRLRPLELGKRPLVDQDQQPIDLMAIGGQRQQQSGV